MEKYTFFYIVGGRDVYYKQLNKSINSLNRIKTPHKIKILDVGNKLKSHGNIEVIYTDKIIDTKELFWKYKFYLCQQLDTEYGIYLDCDTIVCSDRLEEIPEKIGNTFGVIHHFYVKNFDNFKKIFRHQNSENFIKEHKLTNKNNFYTGGVFIFHNNSTNIKILRDIFEIHNNYTLNIKTGMYDETFLSLIVGKNAHTTVGGSFNHCSMKHMPLKIENNVLKGKNPFDNEFEEVFILHGTTDRQLLGLDFNGEIRKKVTNLWNV